MSVVPEASPVPPCSESDRGVGGFVGVDEGLGVGVVVGLGVGVRVGVGVGLGEGVDVGFGVGVGVAVGVGAKDWQLLGAFVGT
jgi:hypothetical protein